MLILVELPDDYPRVKPALALTVHSEVTVPMNK